MYSMLSFLWLLATYATILSYWHHIVEKNTILTQHKYFVNRINQYEAIENERRELRERIEIIVLPIVFRERND